MPEKDTTSSKKRTESTQAGPSKAKKPRPSAPKAAAPAESSVSGSVPEIPPPGPYAFFNAKEIEKTRLNAFNVMSLKMAIAAEYTKAEQLRLAAEKTRMEAEVRIEHEKRETELAVEKAKQETLAMELRLAEQQVISKQSHMDFFMTCMHEMGLDGDGYLDSIRRGARPGPHYYQDRSLNNRQPVHYSSPEQQYGYPDHRYALQEQPFTQQYAQQPQPQLRFNTVHRSSVQPSTFAHVQPGPEQEKE